MIRKENRNGSWTDGHGQGYAGGIVLPSCWISTRGTGQGMGMGMGMGQGVGAFGTEFAWTSSYFRY